MTSVKVKLNPFDLFFGPGEKQKNEIFKPKVVESNAIKKS